METELRKHLNILILSSEDSDFIEVSLEAVMGNEDVRALWGDISVNWADDELLLLELMVRHWITLRGFSYVGSFMERYKQNLKKTVEKEPGFRKTLNNTKVDHIAFNIILYTHGAILYYAPMSLLPGSFW